MSTATLLLRLDGPLQAWTAPGSRWEHRPSMPRPTKSGVAGLVANAFGRSYTDDVSDLAGLRFGCRADKAGDVTTDLQTVGSGTFPLDGRTVLDDPGLADQPGMFTYAAPRRPVTDPVTGRRRAGWTTQNRTPLLRQRSYLAGAAFLAAFTGDTPTIVRVESALARPARAPYLGRSCCPPAHPILFARLDGDQHDTWLDTVPLLPGADRGPVTGWWEDPSGTLTYEQPAPGRDTGPILLATRPCNPALEVE